MLYDIVFWNPGHRPVDMGHSFGCATLGFFTEEAWVEPNELKTVTWKQIEGRAFGGTFDELLRFATRSEKQPNFILPEPANYVLLFSICATYCTLPERQVLIQVMCENRLRVPLRRFCVQSRLRW